MELKITYNKPRKGQNKKTVKKDEKKNPFQYSTPTKSNYIDDCKDTVPLGLSGAIPQSEKSTHSTNSVEIVNIQSNETSTFTLDNSSFIGPLTPMKMAELPSSLYQGIPKAKVQINRPKRIRKRNRKQEDKKGKP